MIIMIMIIISMIMIMIMIISNPQTLYNVFAATVMDCIAEIGLDPNGVQKCVEVSKYQRAIF